MESKVLADFFETDFVLLRESLVELVDRPFDAFFFEEDAGEGGELEEVDEEEERFSEDDL